MTMTPHQWAAVCILRHDPNYTFGDEDQALVTFMVAAGWLEPTDTPGQFTITPEGEEAYKNAKIMSRPWGYYEGENIEGC